MLVDNWCQVEIYIHVSVNVIEAAFSGHFHFYSGQFLHVYMPYTYIFLNYLMSSITLLQQGTKELLCYGS